MQFPQNQFNHLKGKHHYCLSARSKRNVRNPKFPQSLTIFCDSTARFVSDLVVTQIVGFLKHRLRYKFSPVSSVEEIKQLTTVDLKEADPHFDPGAILTGLYDREDIVGREQIEPRHLPVPDHGMSLTRARLTIGETRCTPTVNQ